MVERVRDTPVPIRTGRLLIVDDEAALLVVLARTLGRHYAVERAPSGEVALALLTATPGFDLVLCDWNLPELNGPDLYRTACARWPELRGRFLFMTGDAGSAFDGESRAMPTLAKPFDAATLLAAVAEHIAPQLARSAG